MPAARRPKALGWRYEAQHPKGTRWAGHGQHQSDHYSIRPKRFHCPVCEGQPTTTQPPDWYDPKAIHTKAYERHLIVQLINSTRTDVTEKEDVSYAAVLGVLDRWIATTVDWDTLPPCPTLGLDEIALRKGHRDVVAVITARDTADDLHGVAVLPDRLKSTVVAWLTALPAAVRARITTVCTRYVGRVCDGGRGDAPRRHDGD